MASVENTSPAQKGRYRVDERSCHCRFVDLYATCPDEARKIAESLDDAFFHEIEYEEEWEFDEVKQVDPDSPFYPLDESYYDSSLR